MPETPDRILRLKTVLSRTGLSRSTLYRKMQDGSFPRNVRISTRCAGWRESAVETGCAIPCSIRLRIIRRTEIKTGSFLTIVRASALRTRPGAHHSSTRIAS